VRAQVQQVLDSSQEERKDEERYQQTGAFAGRKAGAPSLFGQLCCSASPSAVRMLCVLSVLLTNISSVAGVELRGTIVPRKY